MTELQKSEAAAMPHPEADPHPPFQLARVLTNPGPLSRSFGPQDTEPRTHWSLEATIAELGMRWRRDPQPAGKSDPPFFLSAHPFSVTQLAWPYQKHHTIAGRRE